nr:uncharacterized protein LOC117602844 isoform X2 [Osmia lignaria]
MLAGVKNVWTWYSRIREWFLENDPVMISKTALALSRGLPKNDNDILLINCMCCSTLHDQRTKLADSSTSVRKKRLRRNCLFRHCSGTVYPQKFMKRRRRKHPCVRIRVSQDMVVDYWKTCDKLEPGTSNVNDAKMHEKRVDAEDKNIKVLQKSEKEIANKGVSNMNSFENEEKQKDVGKEDLELCRDKTDSESKTLLESLCVCKEKASIDYNSSKLSEIEHNVELNQTFCQCVNKQNISAEVANISRKKHWPKCFSKGTPEVHANDTVCRTEKIDADKYSSRKTLFKESESDTSISESMITDNGMDSILYRELRKKCVENRKNIDEKTEDLFDNVSSFFSRQKQKCKSKRFVNKHRFHWKDTCSITDRQNDDTLQKKNLSKHFSQNCFCTANYNSSRESSYSKLRPYHRCKVFTNLRKNNCPCEHVNTKKKKNNNHSVTKTRPSKYTAQSLRYKEKPTLIIFKNNKSNRSKILEETKFDNSTYSSSYSSSTILTDITVNSLQDDPVVCWYPHYKSSRYVSSTSPQKYSKYNTRINPSELVSSSSCLSSSKRCHSSAIMSQNSVYNEQRSVSSFSSSCTRIPRWERRYPRIEKRTKICYSSPSSSCSLTSLSTYRDNYNLERSNINQTTCNRVMKRLTDEVKELKETQKSWRRPRCCEQEGRIIYTDKPHVAWNLKNTY